MFCEDISTYAENQSYSKENRRMGRDADIACKGWFSSTRVFLSLHLFPRGPGAFPLAKVLLKGQLLE